MAVLDGLVNLSDFERRAKQILPKQAADYYGSGAGREISLKLNKSIYSQ